ncbi:hypothetical protein NC653_007363 [Populus alba x Populus x berolinensis]|uniref:Uncharacterized protein n=1 Tax=Populus alba x Populus x berolinensis TaxID=444605 RepID=A0AAD6WE99_9ROSI|nr:hypothetical protein NC653_007363 [Populus alba x Populus x berolinensis]
MEEPEPPPPAAGGVEDVEADEYELNYQGYGYINWGKPENGQDIQGIPWECNNNGEGWPITMSSFIITRIRLSPPFLHFQVDPCTGHTISGNLSEVIDFAGHKHAGSLLEGFTQTQISTIAVKDNFLVAGGFHGELTCKRLDKKGVSFCTRTTYDDNAITNAIEIYDSMRGGINFMSSNNDGGLREYDLETFQLLNHFRFPWPVNHTSVSPDRRLIAVTVSTVEGHLDYSFASAWHPDGRVFATGNQDKTCRVWDIRKLSSPTAILKGNLGAVRSICFSSDGQFMYVAEPADFVHVYSTQDDYRRRQEIDFFGEISGVALSPDDESLYIGIWDRTYASLLQYNKRHTYGYLDSYL